MPRVEHNRINEFTPLSVTEQTFLKNYTQYGNYADAVENTPELGAGKSRETCTEIGSRLMKKPHILAEYKRMVEIAREQTQATATEVMEYFTRVMRGEEKDQFGLDAPLSERTKAAQELAKRTIDIENREAGKADRKSVV